MGLDLDPDFRDIADQFHEIVDVGIQYRVDARIIGPEIDREGNAVTEILQ